MDASEISLPRLPRGPQNTCPFVGRRRIRRHRNSPVQELYHWLNPRSILWQSPTMSCRGCWQFFLSVYQPRLLRLSSNMKSSSYWAYSKRTLVVLWADCWGTSPGHKMPFWHFDRRLCWHVSKFIFSNLFASRHWEYPAGTKARYGLRYYTVYQL